MKLKFSKKAVSVALLLIGALHSFTAHAGSRTVYFDQSAVASSINGFKGPTRQSAKCRLVISNPSNSTQDFTITIFALSKLPSQASSQMASLVASPNPSSGFFTTTGAPTNAYITTAPISLGNNSSQTFDFKFADFPLYNEADGANSDQQLSCRGKIDVSDHTAATPGFAVANGMILTFSESSASQTAGSTSTSTAYVGSAVYTQIPMSINGGKPF